VSAKHVIGIDLGTTHCALARVSLAEDAVGRDASPEIVPVLQIISKGNLDSRALLPSFLYMRHESEGADPLPWDPERTYVVGEYARSRGIEAPNRLIASAKSWLCHPGVDRRSGILPQGAPEDVEPISPVETSFRFLEHLSEAYAHAHDGAELASEEVVLTVPASFDASARELTVEAAMAAGLDNLTLLEEPQAALYAWIEARGDAFRKELQVGDVILVVDVGGGTTDFSAIEVRDEGGSMSLSRVAVGDHILLGGDNMDLALAHLARQKLLAAGKEVDRLQMTALTFAARAAKERLLSDATVTSAPIAIAGRGSQLLGSALRTELTQEEVEKTLLEGFFPQVEANARPVVRARGALTQLGLPYASDAGVTRHLAAFLAKQASAIASVQTGTGSSSDRKKTMLCPTAVLFNGGVMKAPRIQARISETLNHWMREMGAPLPRILEGGDLDCAVAKGAAYYGLARRGRGLRIRGGTARAYYVGIESAVPAVPGIEPPITALCVAPFGMEEGTEASLPPELLGVVVGENVHFRFFGSTTRREDTAGTTLEHWKEGELEELPPIEVTLPAEGRKEGDVVPVRLGASVTEVGTLLLSAIPERPLSTDERWKIELSVREDHGSGGS
jgi:molecular chaperone DnaK (HSP70)